MQTKGEIDPSSVDPPVDNFDGVPLPYERRSERRFTTVSEIEKEKKQRLARIPYMSASSVHSSKKKEEEERRKDFLKRTERKSWDE